jgi:hypothetical protein
MKAKTFLAFYLTFLFLALAGIGLYQNGELPDQLEIIHIVILLGIVGIGLYQAYLRIRARRSGQPPDDELSLDILHRAGTAAFLISLYLWGLLIYLYMKIRVDAATLFSIEIPGMAVLFAGSWLFFKIRAAKNA